MEVVRFTTSAEGGRKTVFFNRAEHVSPFRMPTRIFSDRMGGRPTGGIKLWRRSDILHPVTYEAALGALGFDLPPDVAAGEERPVVGQAPNAAEARAAESVFDLPDEGPFNFAMAGIINRWAEKAVHYDGWNDYRLDLAGRYLLDPRMVNPKAAGGLFLLEPVAERHLGAVLAAYAARPPEDPRSHRIQTGIDAALPALNGLRPEILVKYEAALRALAEGDGKRPLNGPAPVVRALFAIERYKAEQANASGG